MQVLRFCFRWGEGGAFHSICVDRWSPLARFEASVFKLLSSRATRGRHSRRNATTEEVRPGILYKRAKTQQADATAHPNDWTSCSGTALSQSESSNAINARGVAGPTCRTSGDQKGAIPIQNILTYKYRQWRFTTKRICQNVTTTRAVPPSRLT